MIQLGGGDDGLDVLGRVVTGAPAWLGPAGTLLVESSTRQAPVVCAAMTASGLEPAVVHDDETGGTAVVGRR